MNTESAIAAEYARIRKLHINDLRSLAQIMLQEAATLERTDFVPQSHWQSSIPGLTKQVTELHILARFMQAGT